MRRVTTNLDKKPQYHKEQKRMLYIICSSLGSIQYSVLSPDDIVNFSEVALINPSLYDNTTRIPMDRGPLDLKMGLSCKDLNMNCTTCGQDLTDCPGHFGYIRLALPIFHVGYFNEIINILQCICKKCSNILLDDQEKRKYKNLMLKTIKEKNYTKRQDIYKKFRAECKKPNHLCCKKCQFTNGKIKKMLKLPTTIQYFNQELFDQFIKPIKNQENNKDSIYQDIQKQIESVKSKEFLQYFNPLMTLEVFNKINDEDVILFDINPKFTHPRQLIITTIIAPPACIRPSVQEGDAGIRHDDLTIKIKDFIERNNRIQSMIEDGEELSKINTEWQLLQFSHCHYLNAATPNLPIKDLSKNEKKDIRALAQRLKGKKGRFRQNLSGKRSNFTGRTVISPDPNLPIDNVVIPLFMAKILTFPHCVTSKNIDWLKRLIINGPDRYPGAINLIKKHNNERFHLGIENRRKLADQLQVGDIVERHIQNGEIVLFNRQPSLHRISIMAFKANIQKWNTLRFNECCCAPFNADFDGDEMNIHVPQTLEARAEAGMIMDVKKNLITPKNGETIIALVQDFLTCGYLITHKDQFFDRAQFCQLCCFFSDANEQIDIPPPAIIYPVELWTGKQIISMILKPNRKSRIIVNFTLQEKCYDKVDRGPMCPKDGFVIFYKSELLSGNLGKTTLGSGSKNGIFYRLIKDVSPEISAQIMTRFAKLSARWITNYGMTIGISDVTPSPSLAQQNEMKKDEAIKQCINEGLEYEKQQKYWDRDKAREMKAHAEGKISEKLNKVRDDVGAICVKELPHNNGPLIMATCGSKGSTTNLSQMIGCVGQQSISGRRVPNGFSGRTLPTFVKDAIFPHPEALGFVRNSFFSGLTPPEFFFHTMAGRESLVDTAIKTADTGYMSRRLVHFLEDLSIEYDQTVRTCDKKEIVQFRYGGDGVCPWESEEKIGSQNTQPVNLNTILNYVQTVAPYNYATERALTPYEIIQISMKNLVEKKFEYIQSLNLKSLNNSQLEFQFNEENVEKYLQYKINKESKKFNISIESGMLDVLEPLDCFKDYVLEFFGDIIMKIIQIYSQLKLQLIITKNDVENSLAQQYLNKEININKHIADSILSLTRRQINLFFQVLWIKYSKSLIEPGEPVGAVAATSISEPATQMTLKSFHHAGIASMNVTQGVPRMKEIIDAAKKSKSPIIEVVLKKIFQQDEKVYKTVRLKIEKTYLDEITEYYKEVYSNKRCYLLIKLDKKKIESIQNLGVDISFESIKQGILQVKKVEIKENQIEEDRSNFILRINPIEEGKAQKTSSVKKAKNLLFKLHNWKRILPQAIVFGMNDVKKVVISKEESKKGGVSQVKYKFMVEGNSLKYILALDEVDETVTSSIDIQEVAQVLGIEAARQTIINEITNCIKQHSITVDRRHLALVADTLTSKGRLYGSTRQGIYYLKDSTLMLASFEKTTEILYGASLQGRYDKLDGVSERIIIGQQIPMGTGTFDLMWDQGIITNKDVIKSKEYKTLFN